MVRFLKQFNNPLIYVLLITATITLVLGAWLDASVILGVVAANAIIGYIQESKAERAINALQQMLTHPQRYCAKGTKSSSQPISSYPAMWSCFEVVTKSLPICGFVCSLMTGGTPQCYAI